MRPRDAEALGAALGAAVAELGATLVLSPALGGIVIGQEVGRALDVPALFAERADGVLTLRRGLRHRPATAYSSSKTSSPPADPRARRWRWRGRRAPRWWAPCAIVDRSGGNQGLDVPFRALLPMTCPTYQPDACPLARRAWSS